MTFEELQRANELINTTAIQGKEYAQVNERIKAFRFLFPTGTIETNLVSNVNGVAVFKAVVRIGETILGVGHAYEKEGTSFINKTSYIENCETSAVGRALGMAGFGIDTSVASAEEVQTAILNQEQKCEECGQEIMDTVIKGGNIWPSAKIISYSQRRFNKILCPDCQKKKMKEDA